MKCIDCHNHCCYSFDSDTPIETMVQSAISKNIGVFAITDHAEVNFNDDQLEQTIAESVYQMNRLKEKYKEITLLSGFELGQPNQNEARAGRMLSIPDVDMIIGSYHNLIGLEDFYYMDFASMSDNEITSVLARYYDELYETVKCGGFDSLAHIIYPFRYLGDRQTDTARFDEKIAAILSKLVESGIALEFNTKSLAQNKTDSRLMLKYLKFYHDLGGIYVTVGSDAHNPADIGRSIPEAYDLLKQLGFQFITYFEKRQHKILKI